MSETEFGADIALFKNRLGLNVTVYTQNIEDLLLTRPLPPTVGGNFIVTNEGSMTNNGLELMLQGSPVATGKVRWDLGLMWSRNRNTVDGINGALFLRGSDGVQAAL